MKKKIYISSKQFFSVTTREAQYHPSGKKSWSLAQYSWSFLAFACIERPEDIWKNRRIFYFTLLVTTADETNILNEPKIHEPDDPSVEKYDETIVTFRDERRNF